MSFMINTRGIWAESEWSPDKKKVENDNLKIPFQL